MSGTPTARMAPATEHHFVTNTIGALFLPAVALVTAPVLARALGPEGRGVVAGASAPYLLMAVVGALGIPDAVTFFVARSGVRIRTLRFGGLIALGLGVLSMLGILTLSGWLGGDDSLIPPLVRVAAIPLPLYLCLGVVRGFAQGLNRWRLVATEQAIFGITRLVAIVGLLAVGHLHELEATLVFVISPVLGGLAYLPLFARTRSYDEGVHDPVGLGRVMSYGLRVWIGAIAGVLMYRLDQTLMIPLSNSQQLGIYAVAVSVGEIPSLVTTSVQTVSLARESKAPSLDALASTSRVATLVCAALAVCLASACPIGVPLFFGRDFSSSTPVVWVLTLAAVIGTSGGVAGAGLTGRGRPGLRSIALTAACLVNTLLIVILVPPFGAMGAAVAMVGGTGTTSVVAIWMLRRWFGASPLDFVLVRRADFTEIRSTATKLLRRQRPVPRRMA